MKVTHTVGENSELYDRYDITDIDGERSGAHDVISSQLCEVIHALEKQNERLQKIHRAQVSLFPDELTCPTCGEDCRGTCVPG